MLTGVSLGVDVEESVKNDTISLLDLLTVVVKRKTLIISTTLIAAILIVVFSVTTVRLPSDSPWNLLPNVYRPSVLVLVKSETESQSTITSLLSSGNPSPIANLMGIGSGVNTSAELAQALLEGNAIKDQIALEFEFVERYNITKFPKTSARNMIENSLDVEYFADANILEISYENIDKVFATKVLSEIVLLLENTFKDLTQSRVRRKKQFLEERLEAVESDLRFAQNALVEFQKKYNIIDISLQAEEHVRRINGLVSQVIDKELEMHTKLEYLKSTDPQLVRLQNEIDKIKMLISELQNGFQMYSVDSIPQNRITEISPKYLNLNRDLTIQETIYSMMRQQFETVKIEETDTSQIFQVIEEAEVPEIKYGPSRSKICVVVTAIAFLFAVFAGFMKEYLEKVKLDPVESEKFRVIKNMISRKGN